MERRRRGRRAALAQQARRALAWSWLGTAQSPIVARRSNAEDVQTWGPDGGHSLSLSSRRSIGGPPWQAGGCGPLARLGYGCAVLGPLGTDAGAIASSFAACHRRPACASGASQQQQQHTRPGHANEANERERDGGAAPRERRPTNAHAHELQALGRQASRRTLWGLGAAVLGELNAKGRDRAKRRDER